jgi:hypothetical protein
MGVPPGNRPAASRDWFRGVPERYVAGADTRGRQEGWPYPWSQQVIHEISGLEVWRRDSQIMKFVRGSGGMIGAQSINNISLLRAECFRNLELIITNHVIIQGHYGQWFSGDTDLEIV